ncbi:MAG TPA: ABC transporter substrate-binding protein [Rhodocyclaceae bacterium]|nr:ABC transporter substrate-binding protein [Rhodocyclaceae bacterium]
MERRRFLKGAGLAGILAAGTAPAIIHAQEVIRWRLASSFPKALDTIYGAAEDFANAINQMSGGKFEVQVFAGGELVPAFGVLDAVQQGTIELAHTAPYYFFGKNEAFALDCAVPFGLNSRMLTAWMYDGGGNQLMNEFYAKYNIVRLPMGNTGAQMGGWYRKEIKSVDDIKGLKIRISGFAGRVLTKLGGVPQSIPGGEIYQALEKGTIDATEWVGPYDDLKLGFYKVAPHYYYPGWWEGGPQLTLYINKEKFAALPKEYQEMIRTAASHAHVTMQAKYDARNPQALKQLIANGAQVHRFPKDVMDAAFKARNEVFAELNDTNPDWKKIYTEFEKFLRDQYAWFRLAELSYDQYMASVKL